MRALISSFPVMLPIMHTAMTGSALGQTCINNVCFVDRAAAGQTTIGNIRGAVCVLDYDNDGFMDLAIADNAGLPHRLFHNQLHPSLPGNRRFVDVTSTSGINDAEGTACNAGGVISADYNNDGFADLFFTGIQTSPSVSDGLLYRNNGTGANPRFTNVSVAAGVRGTNNRPESISWTDFDHDGFVDLFLANMNSSATPARLLRNQGNGTFADNSGALPSLSTPGHIYSHLWMDYDGDGWDDCIMMQNFNPPALLKNVGSLRGVRSFTNVASDVGYTQLGPAPMGIAAGDYDNDGDFDLGITDASVGTYYRNEGDGTMTKVTPFGTFFGWGITWIDVDNDGDLDNYQAGSWGGANIDALTRNPLIGTGGSWTDISGALNTTSLASQYCVQVDFNNDGRQDLITVNPGFPGQFISVYENISTTGNHWFKLNLRGDGVKVNRSAIGAVARVKAGVNTQVRQVVSGSTQTATEDLRLHFGLGNNTLVTRIEVLWPRLGTLSNRTDVYTNLVSADQIMTLEPLVREPGDVNMNGTVNVQDLLAVISGWGPCPNYPTLCPGDAHPIGLGDDVVNVQDMLAVIANWG